MTVERSPTVDGNLAGSVRGAIRRRLGWPLFHRLPLSLYRCHHDVRRRLMPSRYTAADPFALLQIDPNAIEWSLLPSVSRVPQYGRVVDGEWDRQWESFATRPVPRAIRQRYKEGIPWEETSLKQAFETQLDRFGLAWGYTSLDGFTDRCREIDALYDRLQSEGYRRQDELVGQWWMGPTIARLDEINVDIGRDGTIFWHGCGQHRLAIARVLSLERVPVIVQRRHRQWEQLRTQGAHAPDNTIEHPDIAETEP